MLVCAPPKQRYRRVLQITLFLLARGIFNQQHDTKITQTAGKKKGTAALLGEEFVLFHGEGKKYLLCSPLPAPHQGCHSQEVLPMVFAWT